jgi:hypothetical protein
VEQEFEVRGDEDGLAVGTVRILRPSTPIRTYRTSGRPWHQRSSGARELFGCLELAEHAFKIIGYLFDPMPPDAVFTHICDSSMLPAPW